MNQDIATREVRFWCDCGKPHGQCPHHGGYCEDGEVNYGECEIEFEWEGPDPGGRDEPPSGGCIGIFKVTTGDGADITDKVADELNADEQFTDELLSDSIDNVRYAREEELWSRLEEMM